MSPLPRWTGDTNEASTSVVTAVAPPQLALHPSGIWAPPLGDLSSPHPHAHAASLPSSCLSSRGSLSAARENHFLQTMDSLHPSRLKLGNSFSSFCQAHCTFFFFFLCCFVFCRPQVQKAKLLILLLSSAHLFSRLCKDLAF